jgi:hypothetical protein
LYGACGQERFLAEIRREQEEKMILQTQLARYQKSYTPFTDAEDKKAVTQVSKTVTV